jgi:predicted phage baseplate assembly protein
VTGLDAPDLDDRRFEDLVAEARSLIPRYTPEWTDHNDSDPGIALVQLFAWFTDQTLYRVNQIPERAYIKFLQLLGIQTRPATPASVELTFTTASPITDAPVPTGTQVATSGGDPGPVVFEVAEGFTAVGPRLVAIQVYDGFAYRDVTVANDVDGQAFPAFGAHAHDGAALLLGFETPGAFTSSPITLHAYVRAPADARGVAAHEIDDATQLPLPAQVVVEFHDGTGWEPTALQVDETRALSASGRMVVAGAGPRAARVTVGVVATPLHWVRVRLLHGDYQVPPRLDRIAPNTVRALQAVTLRDEVLGGSTGLPDQRFALGSVPVVRAEHGRAATVRRRADGRRVVVRDVELVVDEGGGPEPWQQVEDLLASRRDDAHFTLDRTTGEIRFGDGRTGRIPVANALNPDGSIVARWYRAGGSAAGNVGADTLTTLQTAAPGITAVTNALAATGGADEESVADAKRRAPAALKAKGRAVTAEDFEVVALDAPAAVGRVHALPLRHPRHPNARVPGAVTVIVVPAAPGAAPQPTDATLHAVCRHLNRHRLLTTEVFATGPTYRRVRVRADLVVARDRDLAAVRRAVSERVSQWLHPLHGGDDGLGWPFGGTVYASALLAVVLGQPGVARIRDNQLEVELDGEVQAFCRDVELRPGELIEALDHELLVAYR